MEYGFSKDKIPKHLCYPLKRSLLDEILNESETERIQWVTYSIRAGGNVVVRTNFIGESHKLPTIGRIGVTIYAVPVEEKSKIERLLIEKGLPRLVEWLKKVETLGEGWRSKTRLFEIHFMNNEISFAETK
jgi:hypothetical protein